jgi:hypothetical protein
MALKENTLHARSLRVALHTAGWGLMAASLLVRATVARAQDDTTKPSSTQDTLYDHESGFLGDAYTKLQPDPKNSDLLDYFKNPDVLKTADSFILDPVVIYLLPEAAQREIAPADLAQLAATFEKDVKEQLTAGKFKIVTKPAPGVVTIRLAITNVQPNGGKENAAVQGATDLAIHGAVPGLSMAVPRLSVGRVSIEGELVDSMTGDVQAAFMTSKSGRRYFSGLKQYEKWGDIDAAFTDWAKSFRERLEKAQKP